jgi:hypothetical protein
MRRFRVRPIHAFLLAALAAALAPSAARAQDGGSTYRVILYVAEDGVPSEVTLQRLTEVWSDGDGDARLREILAASKITRLEEVTLLPNRETPTLRLGDVTVRIRGAYREPRREAMMLHLEVEGGREAYVKELIAGFDETIVIAYPLAEGDRSIVALLVPTRVGP